MGAPQNINLLYKDTKANITALTSVYKGFIAYATDTLEIGIYTGSAWVWYLKEFQDINRFGFIASYDGSTGTTISFNPSNYTFTLTDSGSGWGYYLDGISYRFTGNKTIVLSGSPPSKATYFIYFSDGTGTLQQDTNPWSLEGNKIPVVMILWDNALTPKYWMADERHTASLDRRAHLYLHTNFGTRWNTGGVPSGYSVAPSSPANANNTFGISATTLYDEDIKHSLNALSDPDGTTDSYAVMYKSSGNWVWEYSKLPYRFTAAGYIQYDNAGTMTQGQTADYYNTYLIHTNFTEASTGVGCYQIMHGKGEFTSLAAAQAENPFSFDFTGFPLAECVIAYQFTWYTNSSYSTSGKCRLAAEPRKLGGSITTSIVPVSGTTAGAVTTDTTSFDGLLSTSDNTVQKALDTLDGHLHDWTLVTNACTRTGDHSFTISGDVTSIFRKGGYIKYNDASGGPDYGVIKSASYGGGTTTVTLFTNTDYVITTSISSVYVSYLANPQGFPHWFNYAATVTMTSGSGFSEGDATKLFMFRVSGTTVYVKCSFLVGSTTNMGTGTGFYNFPIPASSIAFSAGVASESGTGNVLNAGTRAALASFIRTDDMRGVYGTSILGSATFTWAAGNIINLSAWYEF